MTTVAVVTNGAHHQLNFARRFIRGIERHGVKAAIRPRHQPLAEPIVVCWGWRLGAVYRKQGKEVLIAERGYVGDRFAWTSLGWNGLNGRADFRLPPVVDHSRWTRHFAALMKPWNAGGDCIVIMGQHPNDTAVAGIKFAEWANDAIAPLQRWGLPVMFRPHPQAQWVTTGAKKLGGTLDEALAHAAAAVTYNSNSGVDAVLAGVPTIAMDEGSMAWPVTAHDLAKMPVHQLRDAWADRLAWCQWAADEIEDGSAWEHIGIRGN